MTTYKIHPALGVARVGNSPDEFFIGPERPGVLLDPPGGFKDAQCRIKRQAARFWVFEDNAGVVTPLELSSSVTIKWTVSVANKKLGGTALSSQATVQGPRDSAALDAGTIGSSMSPVSVSLGELRTDDVGRLIVLGGYGKGNTGSNPTYDDACDGLVQAEITTGANSPNPVTVTVKAWVVVAPPSFAPQLQSIVTLYDYLFEHAVEQGWRSVPSNPSYVQDVYPILRRAESAQWVDQNAAGHHAFAHPITQPAVAGAIVARLMKPANYVGPLNQPPGSNADMPLVGGTGMNQRTLTRPQYAIMQQFAAGNVVNDWPPSPPAPGDPTPDELDRAALEGCIGGPFAPGVEVSLPPDSASLSFAFNAQDPFRFPAATMTPGLLTQLLTVPWHIDFEICAGDWPFITPRFVLPEGTAAPTTNFAWNRGVASPPDMVTKWHTLGFVVKQGAQYVEVDRCDAGLSIALLTPQLDFGDVAQKPGNNPGSGLRAIEFEIISSASLTLDVSLPQTATSFAFDPPQQSSSFQIPVSATQNQVFIQRIWVRYTTGSLGSSATGGVVVQHQASGRMWTIPLTAHTVARPATSTALVLDRSGSMAADPNHPPIKHDALVQAVQVFETVAFDGDSVALVSYDDQYATVRPLSALSASERQQQQMLVAGTDFQPRGSTSIGGGIVQGRAALAGASQPALVVLTDGLENTPPFIADIGDKVDEHTYAVGLGRPENTSAAVLQALSGNNGGYLLITGDISGQNQFLLEKYFLQILSSINKSDVIRDPGGLLIAGVPIEIPFQVTELDTVVEVILLIESLRSVDFQLRTPAGRLVDPTLATSDPAQSYVAAGRVAFYRLALPLIDASGHALQAGTWYAVLNLKPTLTSERFDGSPSANRRAYELLVHAYSDVSLRVTGRQNGYDPGAQWSLRAVLLECDVRPVESATLSAEITRPDGFVFTAPFARHAGEPGTFQLQLPLPDVGTYKARVIARGTSGAGHPLSRERVVTAAVWHGGDEQARNPPSSASENARGECFCSVLDCLLARIHPAALERAPQGLSELAAALRAPLASCCKHAPSKLELSRMLELESTQRSKPSDLLSELLRGRT